MRHLAAVVGVFCVMIEGAAASGSGMFVTAVLLERPAIHLLAPQRVSTACEGHSSAGCTQFDELMMVTVCVGSENGWRVRSEAKARPIIYLSATRYLQHELLHIVDFRDLLREHVQAVESSLFEHREQCERYADAVVQRYPNTMARIARISAARRDGKGHRLLSEDHLVVAKAEVMPKFVHNGLTYLADDGPAAARHAQNRTAENRNLVGQRGEHVVSAMWQGDASIDPQQFVRLFRSVAENFEVFYRWLLFDDDGYVLQ